MTDTSQIKRLLRAAESFFARARYEEAIVEYEKVKLLDPASARAFNRCGDAYYAMARSEAEGQSSREEVLKELWEEASKNFERAASLDAGNAEAHYKYGLALFKLEDYNGAISRYVAATDLKGDYVDAHFAWGEALSAKKLYPDACRQFEKVVSIRSDHGAAYHSWGAALVYARDYKLAAEKYELADEHLDSSDRLTRKRLFHNWGSALGAIRLNDEAISKFERAITLDEEGTQYATHNSIALVYDRLYKDDKALEHFERATRGGGNVAVITYNNWGNCLLRMRKYNQAIEMYDKAIEINPDYFKAVYNKAYTLWQQGRYKVARRVWKEACVVFEKGNNSNPTLDLKLYADSLFQIFHKTDEAEAAYRKALEHDPEEVNTMLGLVTLYLIKKDEASSAVYKNGAQTEAEEIFFKAERILCEEFKVRVEPERLLLRGKLYLTIKKYEKAKIDYLRAVELLKGTGYYMELETAYAELGTLYARLDDFKTGAGYFEKALEENPDNLQVRSHLAEAYCKLGSVTRSEVKYDEVFEVTDGHVESFIGRGELYRTMGDKGETEMYDYAIRSFTEAIELSKSREASKILWDRELAAVLYARGYSSVKIYEASKPRPDEMLLIAALSDFRMCFQKDKCHLKAKLAQNKLSVKLSYGGPQQVLRTAGPYVIFVLALFVFLATQYFFFNGKPLVWSDAEKGLKSMGAEFYALLTFGSLIFMVAGLSLPQLLKIKIAGVELEKSSVDQIQPSGNLGIGLSKS